MQTIESNQLSQLLAPVAVSCGLQLWGIELLRHRSGGKVRVFIEHEDGITVDHCSSMSRLIDPVITVKEPQLSSYDIEVSSPGLDRKFFHLEQLKNYINMSLQINIHSWSPHLSEYSAESDDGWIGVKSFKGTLSGLDMQDQTITINDYKPIKWNDIAQARLLPSFD